MSIKKIEGEIKTFPDKQNMIECIASRYVLKRYAQVLHAERKCHQAVMLIHTHKNKEHQ